MQPQVHGLFDAATNTVTYVVHDPASKAAVIIDPVLDFSPRNARISTASAGAVLDYVRTQGLDLRYVLETHAHADHLSAAHHIREQTGAPVVIGAHITDVQTIFAGLFEADDVVCDGSVFDVLVADGDELPLGNLSITVLHTPGHTPACVTYIIGDAAFVGDTVFMPDYGTARADFPGGDARTLYHSIRKILDLPKDTRLFTGHDYPPETRAIPAWEASVADHRATNIHIHDGIGEDAFVAMREARDKTLAAPLLILPALQVNIRAGNLPPATPEGHVYLRLPVNAI